MNHGLERLRAGFPLSLRLVRAVHEILLSKGRGRERLPGEFRGSQNWIGGSRPANAVFAPPPQELVIDCMNRLELFLHQERTDLSVRLKTGLIHVQFGTIHPYLDGNGRLGRLLITFLVCASGDLCEPILYLSLYFKQPPAAYYDLLKRIRTKGDWETWLDYFLTGVRDTAEQAATAARPILAVFEDDCGKFETVGRFGAAGLRTHAAQHDPVDPARCGKDRDLRAHCGEVAGAHAAPNTRIPRC